MNNFFEIQDNKLTKYTGSEADVVIPEGVEIIGEKAFAENSKLVSLKMPDSVLCIGSNAFYKCAKLKTVEFSRNLERMEYQAFCRCKGLKEIVLPDTLRSLGSGVFAGCEKLSSIRCDSKVFVAESDPFSAYNEKTPAALFDKNGMLIFLNILYKYDGNADEVVVPEGVTHIAPGVFRSGQFSWEKILNMKKLVLPSTVSSVGNVAFENCKKLETLEMPSGIRFGERVFAGCENLADENGFFIHEGVLRAYFGSSETVTIPAGTKVIEPDIFSVSYSTNPGNKNIREVYLPEGLEEIGHGAFSNCDLLESIVIPKSVHTIGYGAFQGCDHLANVTLPHTVTNMGDDVFSGCRRLADENGFAAFNNVLFGFFGGERQVEVPEGIVEISRGCFKKMGVQQVKLPTSLRKLGAAFTGCDMLEEILIPEGVERIPNSCFSDCTRLKTVVLPSTLKEVGYSAFSGCVALENITLPAGLQAIEGSAFMGCASIREISVPAGVKQISYSAFKNCSALAGVTLAEGVQIMDGQCFADCTALKEICLPSTVSKISYSVFENCTSLEKLQLENKNCAIDQTAFAGCTALADRDGFTVIGDILWKYDGPGGDVVVPEGITALAPDVFREGSFYSRRRYMSFRKSGSVQTITLPSTLKKIGKYALSGCEELKQIQIPENVEVIEEGAFYRSGLTNISLPENALTLGESVFRECKALTGVTLPANLKKISSFMFYECTALTGVAIGAAVEDIGESAFEKCNALTAFAVDAKNAVYAAADGMLTNKAGDALIWFPAGKNPSAYEIPNGFVTVGDRAFIDCQDLKKIYIPESVKNIGSCVFPRRDWRDQYGLKIIEAHPNAGGGTLGEDIFDLPEWSEKPFVHPKLPLHLVKEQTVQLLLALGYCQKPDRYEGEYAQIYKKYVESHEKSLTKKADSMKLTVAAEYFAAHTGGKPQKAINYKKLSEQAKVEMLEQAVMENDLQKAKEVISGCGKFEFTARALGLACLYSSVDMVKLLVENGATFAYVYNPTYKRKYGAAYATRTNQYPVNYSKLIAKAGINIYNPIVFASLLEYHFGDLPACKAAENTEEVRADIAQYLLTAETAKFNGPMAMSYAILWGNTVLAERMKTLGVALGRDAIVGLTDTAASIERNEFMLCLGELPPEKCLYALKTFAELLKEKKIILTQKSFEEDKSSLLNADVLAFVFANTETGKLTKSKLLELTIDRQDVQAMEVLVNAGVFKTTAQRDKAIAYAMENKKTEALAWLMDYKNKTADLAAEAAKKEEKALKELLEDPNSVSALKKKWGYKKLEDGTLQITSYKGEEEEVEVPAMIGKAKVTSIGEEAFYASQYGRSKNWEARAKIRSIVIPEGVVEIGNKAFALCAALEKLVIPASVKKFGENVFLRCPKLRDAQGFLIINAMLHMYESPSGNYEEVVIPEGVREIAPYAFHARWSTDPFKRIKRITLPESLERIGESAFEGLEKLTQITIPAGVKIIGKRAFADSGLVNVLFSEGLEEIQEEAFLDSKLEQLHLPRSLVSIGTKALYRCRKLRDLYISADLKQIGEELLGSYGEAEQYSWGKYYPAGVYVYTPAGSAAEAHMKNYTSVYVKNEDSTK